MEPNGAFHHGERAMQATMGAADRLAQVGAVAIRDHMPRQHRDFFASLPFLVVGSIDQSGQPTASILAGPPGFVQTPDERHLRVAALPLAYDPLDLNLQSGAPLGILGIQPHTRRRNRVNGRVTLLDEHGFTPVSYTHLDVYKRQGSSADRLTTCDLAIRENADYP